MFLVLCRQKEYDHNNHQAGVDENRKHPSALQSVLLAERKV